MDGYKQGKEENHMMKHRVMDQPGENVIFRMKVLAKHRSAFERQVTEAVLIKMKEKDGLLLNSKGGFNQCALPRLQVEELPPLEPRSRVHLPGQARPHLHQATKGQTNTNK